MDCYRLACKTVRTGMTMGAAGRAGTWNLDSSDFPFTWTVCPPASNAGM
jgi:hypothetical protein